MTVSPVHSSSAADPVAAASAVQAEQGALAQAMAGRAAVCALSAAAGLWAGTGAGWGGRLLLVLVCAGLGAWLAWRSPALAPARGEGASAAAGVARLLRLVVPVWRRNVEAARDDAGQSAQSLTEGFANLITQLDSAMAGTVAAQPLRAGSVEAVLGASEPELDRLLSTTRQAVALKDEMLATLGETRGALQDMHRLSEEVQRISRATQLLALNAAVEAQRAGVHGEAFAVVAREVRDLASQSRHCGVRLREHVERLRERIDLVHHNARRPDTEEDELVLQADENARAVLRSLTNNTAAFAQASLALQTAGRQVQQELERILMEMQTHDRVSQMLSAITSDMDRLDQWLGGRSDDLAHTPAQWLERLETSYTMESQRSTHHGMVAVDKQPAVEFF